MMAVILYIYVMSLSSFMLSLYYFFEYNPPNFKQLSAKKASTEMDAE